MAILCKFYNFSPIFFILLCWFGQSKINPILGYICKVVNEVYGNHVISSLKNQLKLTSTYFRYRLVPRDIFFLFRFLLSCIFPTRYQYSSQKRIVGILTDIGEIQLNFICLLIFLCLLRTIKYRSVSIDINVEPVCIVSVTVTSIMQFVHIVLSCTLQKAF